MQETIELVKVESSNILKIGYANESKVLIIIYKNNPELAYYFKGVPAKVAQDFITADSVGKFFHANIRGKYEFKKEPLNEG